MQTKTFVRAPRDYTNLPQVPIDVVRVMCDAFVNEDRAKMTPSLRDRAAAILRIADRYTAELSNPLEYSETGDCLLRCTSSTRQSIFDDERVVFIDWENATVVRESVPAKSVRPERASIDWILLALETSCRDSVIEWLVHGAHAQITDWTIESACRTDWWQTSLPILLSSRWAREYRGREPIVMRFAVLHPDQLRQMPQMFQSVQMDLRLSYDAWVGTAVFIAHHADSEEDCRYLRRIMEPMLHVNDCGDLYSGDRSIRNQYRHTRMHRRDHLRKGQKRNGGTASPPTDVDYGGDNAASVEPTVDIHGHVDWMNGVLRPVFGNRYVAFTA